MKKILSVVLVLVLIAGLTGCMHVEDRFIINEDGSGTMASVIRIEKEVYDSMQSMFESMGDGSESLFGETVPDVITIDGVEYYYAEESTDFEGLAELETFLKENYQDVYVSESGVRFVMDAAADEEMSFEEMEAAYAELGVDLKTAITAEMSLTMPDKILAYSEGGVLSEDENTVTYVLDMEALCEKVDIMVSTAEETTKPTMSVTHKKTYKNAKTVTVKDASGIKVAKYKIKGGKYYSFDLSKTFTKNGTYTVTTQDYYGNKRTRTFTLKDETKPKVSGVTNKKTYSSDRALSFSDNCAVKLVTLYTDDEKIRLTDEQVANGIIVSDEADYKVYIKDVNGNSRTVRFTIK